MKNKEQIEKAARIFENYDSNASEISQAESGGCYHGYKKGYNDCVNDCNELIFKIAHEFFRLGKYSGNTSDTCFSDNYKKLIVDIKNVSK